ncbi:hypothetical protein NQT74_05880 [Alteromonas stellipolaris]|uniref:hypothetical protein n=1 Tax=Alteromonas stellipolaris TaxID=233316 RepID=UPI002118FB0C|nr:hypothetical protein [Alteromonas stellipolaris]MCQ8848100.1 hypothetical protein [Alteromonas stellipolaris]
MNSTQKFDREKAVEFGWNQCSVFNYDSSPELFKLLPPHLQNEANFYIVLSHPCSLLNYSLELEPDLEVATATPVAKADGNCTFGKNPRKLHLEIEQLALVVEVEQKNRLVIPRGEIASCAPLVATLTASTSRALITWTVNRYLSSAFPDEFERRISNKKTQLRKVFNSEVGQKCKAVYVVINESIKDLPDDESYELHIYFTLNRQNYALYDDEAEDTPDGFNSFLKRLTDLFEKINGTRLLSVNFQDDSKLTVAQVESPKLIKWNFDFLSIAAETPIERV